MSENAGTLCSECGKSYSSVTNLNKHIKVHHSGEKIKKEKPRKFYCEHCSRCFLRLFNLQRHIQCYHSETSKERNFRFFCKQCPCRFRYKTNYNQHLKKKHNASKQFESKSPPVFQYKCAICDFNSDKKQLMIHFVESHNIILQETKYTFGSREDFLSWKKAYEYDTNSKFVRDYSTVRDGLEYEGYKCYHYGSLPFKVSSHNNRIRNEHFCPASMKFKRTNYEECSVVVLDTHVGHKLEKIELKITTSNNDDSLLTKIPFNDIFDEVRSSVFESNFPVLTEPDLYRIENSFNLITSLEESDALLGVDLWIRTLQDLNDVILFYKAEGYIFKGYNSLKKGDFVLVMMTNAQSKMLQKYGSHGVCVDRYPGISKCRLNLVTILVEDDVGEVFPCGFLISNKITLDVLEIFFSHVKHKIGTTISPNMFMSGMNSCFVKAWLAIMLEPNIKLFNPWCVDYEWRKNLEARVKQVDTQLAVYQLLCTLLLETDKDTFDDRLRRIYHSLRENQETLDFSIYFDYYFITPNETSRWAYFHKGLNTNMCFERTHRVLKCFHLMGQKVKRFDKTIDAIMRFVRDQYIDRLIDLDPAELTKQKQNILSRHKTSLNMDWEFVTSTHNGGWNVLSSDQTKLYAVQKIKDECDCQLKCISCNCCLHQYICSCVDASISYNMCEHIHLICRHPESASACIPAFPANNSNTVEVTFVEDSNSSADENGDACLIEIIDDVTL